MKEGDTPRQILDKTRSGACPSKKNRAGVIFMIFKKS